MKKIFILLTAFLSPLGLAEEDVDTGISEEQFHTTAITTNSSVKLVQEKLISLSSFVLRTERKKYTLTGDIKVLDSRNDKSDFSHAIAILNYRNGKLFQIEIY